MASVVSAVVALWANIESPLHVGHPAVAYWNALIWLGFFISITFIVAALKSLHDRERQLSRVDSLTGIANRLGFYEYANGEWKRAGRSKQPITLAYLDRTDSKRSMTLWAIKPTTRFWSAGANNADERSPNGHGGPHWRR